MLFLAERKRITERKRAGGGEAKTERKIKKTSREEEGGKLERGGLREQND